MILQQNPLQIALTIAGSDPSGGAGIQADLKTFAALGVYGGAAISCLTVQNTQGVFEIQPVDPELIKDQINYVLNDLDVSHIKIGMVGNGPAATSICEALANFAGEVIYDPVLVSSSGQELIDQNGYETIRLELIERCTVITPNIPELSRLSGLQCTSQDEVHDAVEKLLQLYKKIRSVIVTGGHLNLEKNTVTDYLFYRSGTEHSVESHEIAHPRIASSNTHGTGCTFSAAFTAYHLLNGDDLEAFRQTTRFMETLIKKSADYKIGHGTGPLMHHLK